MDFTLSAIIVTHNSDDVIRECLQSLMGIAKTQSLEIIVVDNASTDDTVKIVSEEFPTVKLIKNENTGFGGGNNRGFQESTGDYIAIINPDLVTDAASLDEMVTYLANNTDIGIVGPKTVDGDENIIITAQPSYSPRRSLAKYFGLERFSPKIVYGKYAELTSSASEPFDVGWLYGACLIVPRHIFSQLNGFDTDFFLFVEDTDICQRTWDMGLRVVYVPSAIAKHYRSTSVAKTPLVTTKHYHISPLLYFRKRRSHRSVWSLKLGYTIELSIKITKRLFSGILRRNKETLNTAYVHWVVLKDVLRF